VANLAVPQASNGVDVLVSLVVPELCHVSTNNVDERIR
jgi:hypothetical protein